MTRLRPIRRQEVRLGMHIHSVERYEHDAVIQFRGYVQAVGRTEEGAIFAQLRGVPYMGLAGRQPLAVDLFEVVE